MERVCLTDTLTEQLFRLCGYTPLHILSVRTGIDVVTIYKYKRGFVAPSLENLTKICRALGTSVEEWFTFNVIPKNLHDTIVRECKITKAPGTKKRKDHPFVCETYGISGTYAIVNRVTGMTYVGQSSNIGKRVQTHLRKLRKGSHCVKAMQEDCIKHGMDSFNLLHQPLPNATKDDLLAAEYALAKSYPKDRLYSIIHVARPCVNVLRKRNQKI